MTEFRRDIPPGWMPGLADYPFKLYLDKLKMWYRLYDGADETVGPLVAGRLQGRAHQLALKFRLARPDGSMDVGDSALIRLPVDEVRDPNDPNIILQHALPSGIQALCTKLRDAFGIQDQDYISAALNKFFSLRQGRRTQQEYAVDFEESY